MLENIVAGDTTTTARRALKVRVNIRRGERTTFLVMMCFCDVR